MNSVEISDGKEKLSLSSRHHSRAIAKQKHWFRLWPFAVGILTRWHCCSLLFHRSGAFLILNAHLNIVSCLEIDVNVIRLRYLLMLCSLEKCVRKYSQRSVVLLIESRKKSSISLWLRNGIFCFCFLRTMFHREVNGIIVEENRSIKTQLA